jgi:type II secretory pathway pseudopilin PulG
MSGGSPIHPSDGSAPLPGRQRLWSPSGEAQRRPEGPGDAAKRLDSRVSLRSPENDKEAETQKQTRARGRARRSPEGGFALVETLVALVILTLSLAALMEIFGGGFRGIRDAEVESAALHLARQQLALSGAEARLGEGERRGTARGLEWRIVVEPYRPPRSAGAAATPEAYWVTSEVRWRPSAMTRQRSVTLTTLRQAGP